jgi:hypothetical protein
MKKKDKKSIKIMINRLIQWLADHGIDSKDIVECISYITDK